MSLLKELMTEDAAAGATSAGAIAGFRAPIGAAPSKKKKTKMRRRVSPMGNFFTLKMVREDIQKFDPADVASKMAAAEKKAKNYEETKSFALEDENGNIVKVTVPNEEAKEFEDALSHALHGDDNEDNGELGGDGENASSMEIAEILFKLKDRFTIVNVDWPEVEEDQEEEGDMDVEGGEGDVQAADDLGGAEGDIGGDEGDMQAGENPEDATATALSQVIDLLKAQADAQRAEANAKKAEADAEIAKANRDASIAKVRQEEEVLDMETYYKKKKDEDKEAKQLAQLAKWKHEMAADEESDEVPDIDVSKTNVSVEQEESGHPVKPTFKSSVNTNNGKLHPQTFIRHVLKHLGSK